MCSDRVRSDAQAPVKNTRPGQMNAGTVIAKLTHRKNRVKLSSIVFSSPAYNASAASITLIAMAPAMPMRTSMARSSRLRMSARATPRNGCGG